MCYMTHNMQPRGFQNAAVCSSHCRARSSHKALYGLGLWETAKLRNSLELILDSLDSFPIEIKKTEKKKLNKVGLKMLQEVKLSVLQCTISVHNQF